MRRILINKVFLTHAKKDLRYRSGIFDKMITKKKKKNSTILQIDGMETFADGFKVRRNSENEREG